MNFVVIAIDGPACSGKSTIAKKLARKLGFMHVNSGSLYRGVALLALRRGVALSDESGLAELARATNFEIRLDSEGGSATLINGVDETAALVAEEVGQAASKIAVFASVRSVLTEVQRALADNHPLVVEGRDAGSVVFPQAPYKYYLDASPEVRIARRVLQLKGESADPGFVERVRAEMFERDFRDRTRSVVPLICGEGAIMIDTEKMTEDEVLERIVVDVIAP